MERDVCDQPKRHEREAHDNSAEESNVAESPQATDRQQAHIDDDSPQVRLSTLSLLPGLAHELIHLVAYVQYIGH